jgi:biotin-(acetyl-CoA carboxylase) ligase
VNLKSSPTHSTFPSGNLLQEFNKKIERDDFLMSMNKNILKFLSLWDNGNNYQDILNNWKSKAYLLNSKVAVSLPNGDKKEGIFSTIDEEGGLILLSNNGQEDIFYAAEIFEGL